MPITMTKPQATVKQEIKSSGVTSAEDVQNESPDLEVPENKNDDLWCTVGFGASYTHNLGNYNSARVEVHLTVPCAIGHIDPSYEIAKEWVNFRLEAAIKELTSDE